MQHNDNKKTNCECPLAGFCDRHGVQKSAHYHKLCQNNPKYFNLWEKCRGPNQNPANCIKQSSNEIVEFKPETTVAEPGTEQKLPSTMEMARNFISSAAKHVKNGMKNVSQELHQERLAICQECPHLLNNTRCGKCGCFVESKAKWSSSSCPIGKW